MKAQQPIMSLVVLLSSVVMLASGCGQKLMSSVSGSTDDIALEDTLPEEVEQAELADSDDMLPDSDDTLPESDDTLPEDEVEALSVADLYGDESESMVAEDETGAENDSSSILTVSSSTPEPEQASQGLHDVFFAYDSWRFSEKAYRTLESNAAWLKAHPHERLVIEGHCDERGTRSYNYVLGEKRAKTVKAYLSSLGVPADQMVVVSFGKDRPSCRQFTTECFQSNRRAHFATDLTIAARP